MKKIAVVLMSLVLFFALTGCQAEETSNVITPSNENTESNNVVEEHYPLTVTDSNGNDITLDKKPVNIVSLTLGTDEMLLSMVDESRIKAISGAIAEDDGISNISDKAANFAKAESNIEVIISMNPDLVFAANWMDQGKVQQLVDAGIPVFSVQTATNLDMQKEKVLEIANIVGEMDKGQEIVDEMNRIIDEVAGKVSNISDDKKVRVLSYSNYGSTNSKGTTFDDICQKAGVINAASEVDIEQGGKISEEAIVQINPDVLIIPAWSYEGKDPNEFKEKIMNDPSFSTINAVKNNRVYMLPNKHTSAVSQYMAIGVEDLAKVVYPDLFK